jgi:YVTN family beta-propeller protein
MSTRFTTCAIVAHSHGQASGFSLESGESQWNPERRWNDQPVTQASPPSLDSRRTWFRVAVIVVSMIVAVAGSVLLVTRNSGQKATTRGVIATLRVPTHPGWIAAGRDALWLALSETGTPVRDLPLLRLDLASGTVEQRILIGGQAGYLEHAGSRLLASVQHVGGNGSGPSLIVALDWRSGRLLARRQFPTAVGPLAEAGNDLWALQVKPGALLRLDPRTLAPKAPPLPLVSGEALGLTLGGGYVWATAPDAAEVLRVDPATRAITPAHVGGFPVGIAVAAGNVWFADRDGGEVGRLTPGTLEPVGEPIHVGGEPEWLASTGHYLFVGDASEGTVRRINLRSGEASGPPIQISPPAKGSPAFAVVPSGSSVWVSSFASNTLTRVSATSTATSAAAITATSAQSTPTTRLVLPPAGTLVARIPLGGGAPAPLGGGAFTVGEGAVWAMSDAQSTLMRIDPKRNAVIARIKVFPPEAAVAGDDAVWVSYPSKNEVSRIDARTNKVTATIHVGPQPTGLALAPGALWVANAGGPSVSRIDPATNRVVTTISVGPKLACCSEHMSLTAVPGALWVAVPNANEIVRVDAATKRVVATVKLPFSPCASLVAGDARVWSAGGGCADVVARIDPGTKKITAKLAEPHPVGLGLAFGSVWVAVIDSANVDRIDPVTGRLASRLHVGGTPVRLAVGFGSVWINDDNGRVLRIQP